MMDTGAAMGRGPLLVVELQLHSFWKVQAKFDVDSLLYRWSN